MLLSLRWRDPFGLFPVGLAISGPVTAQHSAPQGSEDSVMSRINVCVYCSMQARSGEHIFPAALGGRRKNKGILCSACNGGFSELDRHLAAQLHHLRGVLGVRPDHKSGPVPAEVEHDGETILIDGLGRPSYKEPRTLADEPLENGNRRVVTAFANERQMQDWRAEQRRKGVTIKEESVRPAERFITEPIQVEWTFGGEQTFREAARIAINFLAHRFPAEARDPMLQPLKDYIRGKRPLAQGETRPVWHHVDQVAVPASSIELGHQVFLRLDGPRRSAYAVLRFFETAELVVDLGPIETSSTRAVLFNIDPHAQAEPSDLFEVECPPDEFPPAVTNPRVGEEHAAGIPRAQPRLARTLKAIHERQSRLRLAPLVAELAKISATPAHTWHAAIHTALDPHQGSIYRLIEFAAAGLAKQLAALPELAGQGIEACLAAFAEPDPRDPRGITRMAHVVIKLAQTELATALAAELAVEPIPIDRVMLLLEGGPGAAIVGRLIWETVEASVVTSADSDSTGK